MAQRLIKRGEIYWVNLSLPTSEEKEKGIIHELQGTHSGVIISNINKTFIVP